METTLFEGKYTKIMSHTWKVTKTYLQGCAIDYFLINTLILALNVIENAQHEAILLQTQPTYSCVTSPRLHVERITYRIKKTLPILELTVAVFERQQCTVRRLSNGASGTWQRTVRAPRPDQDWQGRARLAPGVAPFGWVSARRQLASELCHSTFDGGFFESRNSFDELQQFTRTIKGRKIKLK